MPTYAFSTTAKQLSQDQREQLAKRMTDMHAKETGAPRYFVQVVFYEVQPGSHFVAGRVAPADQVWMRGDIRSGRTDEVKKRMLERILKDVREVTGVLEENVWVYLSDISAAGVAEFGRVLPMPGGEAEWLQTLPEGLRTRLEATT